MSYRYVTGGTFQVSVTVSDLRGGDVTETKEISVSDPVQPWTDHNVLAGQSIRSLAWWNNAYYAVVSNQLHRSADGINWQRETLPAEAAFSLAKISASPLGLVLVGQRFDSSSGSWVGAIAESLDGLNWTRAELPPGTRALNAVAFGNLTWVAVGRQGQILIKRRGQEWQTSTSSATADLRDVAFGGNQFILVGNSSTALRGTGNGTWTNLAGMPSQRSFAAVANWGHLWAIGGSGVLLTSKDNGSSWQSSLPGTPWRTVDCLAFSGGMLYGSAYHFETDLVSGVSTLRREHLFWLEEGRMGFSADTTPGQKTSALYAGGRLLVGTNEGRVARSNTFSPPSSLVSGPATPTVQIVSHKPRQRVFQPVITLSGLLNARGGLPSLEYSKDGGVTWEAAIVYGDSAPYSWLIDLALEEGDNFLRLAARDESGRRSTVSHFPIRYAVPAELTVLPDGQGRVPAPFLGTTIRDRGVPYRITARPLKGMIFREWLLNGSSISRDNRLTFVLREDSTLTPVFIPNPFPEAGGHFGGFLGTGEITGETSAQAFAAENGFLSVMVSPAGNVSGQLSRAGQRLALRGRLDGFGEGEVIITRRGLPPLRVQLQLALEGAPGMTGSLFVEEEEFPFALARALRTSRLSPHPLAGQTFSWQEPVPGGEEARAPWVLSVRPDGQSLLSGTLPSGAKIRSTTRLLPEEESWWFPLAIALPARTPGMLLGELRVTGPDSAAPQEMAWARWPSRASNEEFLRILILEKHPEP